MPGTPFRHSSKDSLERMARRCRHYPRFAQVNRSSVSAEMPAVTSTISTRSRRLYPVRTSRREVLLSSARVAPTRHLHGQVWVRRIPRPRARRAGRHRRSGHAIPQFGLSTRRQQRNGVTAPFAANALRQVCPCRRTGGILTSNDECVTAEKILERGGPGDDRRRARPADRGDR